MKDSTKQILIIFWPCFVFGFIIGFLGHDIKPEIYMLLVVLLMIMMVFLSKKFIPKSLKNDEIVKKVAIMSDAVGGRGALIAFFVYMFLDTTGYFPEILAMETKYWFIILFFAMTVPAVIASIHYSRNPHKLP